MSKEILASNRKAKFLYDISQELEVGIVLLGPEVKSVLAGGMDLSTAYISCRNGELWLCQANISPVKGQTSPMIWDKPNPIRERKLLAKKTEIRRLMKVLEQRGLTCIPLDSHYSESKKIKLTIGLAKGRNKADKREYLKEREAKKEMSHE